MVFTSYAISSQWVILHCPDEDWKVPLGSAGLNVVLVSNVYQGHWKGKVQRSPHVNMSQSKRGLPWWLR